MLEPRLENYPSNSDGFDAFLNDLEIFHNAAGSFVIPSGDFLELNGSTSLYADTSSKAFIREPLLDAVITNGNTNLWVVEDAIGQVAINGGHTTLVFQDLPTQQSVITLKGGSLDINFLPELGMIDSIDMVSSDTGKEIIYLNGVNTGIEIVMDPLDAPQAPHLRLLSLNDLQYSSRQVAEQSVSGVEEIQGTDGENQSETLDRAGLSSDDDDLMPPETLLSEGQALVAENDDLVYAFAQRSDPTFENAEEPLPTFEQGVEVSQAWLDTFLDSSDIHTMYYSDEPDTGWI